MIAGRSDSLTCLGGCCLNAHHSFTIWYNTTPVKKINASGMAIIIGIVIVIGIALPTSTRNAKVLVYVVPVDFRRSTNQTLLSRWCWQ